MSVAATKRKGLAEGVRPIRAWGVVCLALALIACSPGTDGGPSGNRSTRPGSSSENHPFAGDTSWVAYQSIESGSEGIWLVHPDGTGKHQIAADVPGEEKYARWSPDGGRLVFTTRGGETEPLYTYDLATDSFGQLFECRSPCLGDDEPDFSPDGASVAFVRASSPLVMDPGVGELVPSDCGLWVGDVATREVRRLTSNTDPPCDREYFPHWSPDGTQLVYWRAQHADGQATETAVYVINADGSGEQRLTERGMFAGDPDWSPDGEWIVFSTFPLNEFNFVATVSNLYRIHPDGTELEQLTAFNSEEKRATIPHYSPDGDWIVFTLVTEASRELWAMPADGGEPVQITSGGIAVHGSWQPRSR
jgi:Tol biopolymer transport system component